MKTAILSLVACVLAVGLCHAQRTATVSAEYTYYVPENMTVEQAKQVALQRAMTEAIAVEFGTLVQQVNATTVANDDGKASVGFSSLGTSDVRGEWLRTIGEPEYSMDYRDNVFVIRVAVRGVAREINYLKPRFIAQILRNGTKENFESEEFRNDDYLYVSIKSPVDGYVSVFCKDDSVRCLLPDVSERDGVQRVEANRRHLFFTERGKRLQVSYNGMTEVNAVYIMFSPNPIVRPLSSRIDDGGLAVFSDAEFNRWLADMRNHDRDLQIEVKYIYIRKTL